MIQLTERIMVPKIETQRLILRGLTEDDMPFLFEHFGKDEINEYSSDDNVATLELYEKYLAPRPYLFRLGLVMKETGGLIGTLGFYGGRRPQKGHDQGEHRYECWRKSRDPD